MKVKLNGNHPLAGKGLIFEVELLDIMRADALDDSGYSSEPNRGTVMSVRDSMVDALFHERLPALNHVLRTGEAGSIVIEVITHLN